MKKRDKQDLAFNYFWICLLFFIVFMVCEAFLMLIICGKQEK